MPENMTLEQAQERIVELTEERDNLQTQNDSLSQDNEQLRNDNESLRTLNQKYFNKLIAQEETNSDSKETKEDEAPTCEEFAMNIKI